MRKSVFCLALAGATLASVISSCLPASAISTSTSTSTLEDDWDPTLWEDDWDPTLDGMFLMVQTGTIIETIWVDGQLIPTITPIFEEVWVPNPNPQPVPWDLSGSATILGSITGIGLGVGLKRLKTSTSKI